MTVGIRTILRVLLVFLGLLGPSQAVAQSADQLELWVTNQKGEGDSPPNAVLVYDVGQAGGKPTLTLTRILAGPATMLNLPTGILVTADRVFVANEPVVEGSQPCTLGFTPQAATGVSGSCGFITIYTRPQIDDACTVGGTPTLTNVPPARVLGGSKTRLDYPFGIAINNRNGELYVANQTRTFGFGAGSINVYDVNALAAAPGGVNADIAPIRTIVGGLEGPSYIVYDEVNAELFVANSVNGLVTVHRRNNNGDFIPVRSIREKGAPDETRANPLQQVSGLALVGDELFVAHGGVSPARILVYRRTDSGTPDPLRRIDAVDTPTPGVKSLDDTTGLAVDLQRNLLFSGNDARTTSRGFISVFGRQADGPVAPLLRHQEPPPATALFSPVGLALATRSGTSGPGGSDDYTVTNSGDVSVPQPPAGGAPVEGSVTIEIKVTGTGTVTFSKDDVTVVPPPGITGSPVTVSPFSPQTCTGLCRIVLKFPVSPTTPLGTYQVTVRTHGVLGSDCTRNVDRPTSFKITVTPRVISPGFLNLLKRGLADPIPGSCPVTSDRKLSSGLPFSCDPPDPPCSGSFEPGRLKLTAGHAAESIFSGWSGCNPSTSPECFVDIIGDTTTTVTLSCDRLVHLIVRKDGSGNGDIERTPDSPPPLSGPDITCGNDCNIVNTVVRLRPTPRAGSAFVKWTGCTSVDNGICRVVLSESKTVTATFDRVPIPLTVRKASFQNGPADGSGRIRSADGRIDCGPTCPEQSASFDPDSSGLATVTLTATSEQNSFFVGWKGPTCGAPATCSVSALTCGTSPACTVTVRFTGQTTMEALFVQTPQEVLIARLYFYVFDEAPPSGSNLSELVTAVGPPVPTLTGHALLDAFFDGPTFATRLRSTLTPETYVAVMFRAFLGQEPPLRNADRDYCFREPRPPSADPKCFTERIIEELFKPLVASLGNAAAGPVYQSLLNRAPDTPTPKGEAAAFSGNVLGETLKILAGQEYEERRRSLASGLNQDVALLLAGFRPPVIPDATAKLTEGRKVIESAFRCSSVFQTQFEALFPPTLGCQ